MSLPLDPARIRAEFPAFSEPSLRDQAFFENAGGSYTSRQVLEILDTYYRRSKLQPYGHYEISQKAGAAMDRAFARMAAALGVTEDWIQFGPSTSANTYVLGHAFAQWLKPGDAVIVTNQDHEANTGAWRRLAQMGAEIREWRADPGTGHLDIEDFRALLDEKVKLVAFPHASNIVGEVNPVKDVCAAAHEVGAVVVVDGVSYAPHSLPDLKALGVDIYLFSAYKTYGPHQGVMAIRPELNQKLPNQGHFFNDTKLRYRLTPAGPDHAQIAAAAGIADYLERVAEIAGDKVPGANPFRRAAAAARAQETELLKPLMDYLENSNRARLIGPSDPRLRVPTIALAVDTAPAEIAKRMGKRGVMVGGGHFYAYRLLERMGISPEHGVLRLSFVHYTTPEEIEKLIEALDAEL